MEAIEKVIELYERVKVLEKSMENIIRSSAEGCTKCCFCKQINQIACETRKE